MVSGEVGVVRLLTSQLTSAGYEVLSASSSIEALDAFLTASPDLVILDSVLAGLDGFEVCRRLRKLGRSPIIMLVAEAEEQERMKALDCGADAYIAKPFTKTIVVASTNAALRRWQS